MTVLQRLPILLLLLAPAFACANCSDGGCEPSTLYVDEHLAFPVSHVFISRETRAPEAAVAQAFEIWNDLRDGADFATVARERSDNEGDAVFGGFMGFVQPDGSTPFSGAVEALSPGQLSGLVATDRGLHVIYRHTFTEGREIERQTTIPVYGFYIPWSMEGEHGLTRAEAEERATAARERIASGEITLVEAAEQYGVEPPFRPNCFIANIHNQRMQASLWQALEDVTPGELGPVHEMGNSLGVIRRGIFFRSLVRSIRIQHIEVRDRRISTKRSKEEARELAEKALAEVADDASNWPEMVRKFSDDPGGPVFLGSMGSFTNGQLSPPLEVAILATEPGKIADHVVETPDGFYVLWRAN